MKYLLEANYPNVKEMYFITMPLVKWDLPEKAIGQFNVKGDIDLNFPLWKDTVSLIARGEVSNKLAPFYMRHYHSKHFMWDNDMDKEFRTRIEGD